MAQCRMDAFIASSRSLVFLLLSSGLLFVGCTALPDTSGYTIATIQVKQAVATTGDVVREELLTSITSDAITADQSSVKGFDASWAATMRSLDAMVVHAQSIEQIVDAGNKGSESAKAVADSVKNLVDTIKVNTISGATATAFELSADTVAFVYGEYSKHVSAQSLEDALQKFGPAIAKITVLVEAQIRDAARLFDQQIEAQVQLLNSPAQNIGDADKSYGKWIKQHNELDSLALQATQSLVRAMQAHNPSEITNAKAMLANVEIGRNIVEPRIAQYNTKINVIRQREKAGRNIIGSSELVVTAWGNAHQQLVNAVRERKPVSVDSLTATITEIRTLIQRWREL